MEGTIKSFLPNKEYGFIDGNDGKSYFFHIRDMRQQARPADGLFVSFEECATPKGYRARNVELIAGQNSYMEPISGFYKSRKGAPANMEVAYSVPLHASSRDLDEAKAELQSVARRIGLNGLIDISYSKETGSSGNYRYTIHNFSCKGVLLVKNQFTKNRELSLRKAEELKQLVSEARSNYAAYLEELEQIRRRQAFIRKCFLGAVLAVISMIVFLSIYSGR